jgi:hypothetical protein
MHETRTLFPNETRKWVGHGRDEKYIQQFCSENLKGRDHWEDLGVDEKVIQGCIQKFPDWPPGARTANVTVLCH